MHVKQISFGEDQPGPAAARGEFGSSGAVNGHPCGAGIPPKPLVVLAPGQPGESRLGRCATISISARPASQHLPGKEPSHSREMSQAANQGAGSPRPPSHLPKGELRAWFSPEHRWERGSPTGKGSVTPQSCLCVASGLWPLTGSTG